MSGDRTAFDAVGDAMRAVPGPTEAWADIVGHVAWPLTVLFLVFSFRRELSRAAGTLSRRVASGDVKLGPLALTGAQDSLKPLAPRGADPTPRSDDAVIEALFEVMADGDGLGRLTVWVGQNTKAPDLDVFLNDPIYATARERALAALRGGKDA